MFRNIGVAYFSFILLFLSSNINANELTKNTTKSITAQPILKLDKNMLLTQALVDKAWALRENEKNQKNIADYLLTEPKISNNYELAWKTARLVYFIGNFGVGETRFEKTDEGVALFNYGVMAGKIARNLKPHKVDGQYWYAVDLGSYGLAKGIFASARYAKDGMLALEAAIQIESAYQFYGPSRILGRYYWELPGLFGGSNKKAFELLQITIQNQPNFSNNWTFLGTYYLSIGEAKSALEACSKALSLKSLDGKYEEIRYRKEALSCINKAKARLGA